MLDPDEVRRMRTRLGVTQAALAKMLGVSRRTVQSWETPVVSENHRQIPPERAEQLKKLHRELFEKVRQGL